MADRERDYYFGRTPETIAAINSGSYVLNTKSRITIESDGFSYLMANVVIYDTDGVTVVDPVNYTLYQDVYYTAQEALAGGADETIYGDIEITNATYAGVELYISGQSFGTYTTNGLVYPGANAEFKTVKVNTSTDTAADRGLGTVKVNDGGSNLEFSNGTDWLPVGSTEESSGFNYANPNMEVNIDGYNTYDDGAVAVPVDGTGGTSANLTLSRETTVPLIGDGSLLITKAAADAQGEGMSYDLTIDEGVRGKTTELKFTYKTDTNYVAGDMGMYLYDVDNATILYPSVVDMPTADSAGDYFSTFYTTLTGVNYRLIWHVQTTNALAYTMIVDKVEVGEFSYNLGDGHWIWDSGTLDYSYAFEAINDVIYTLPEGNASYNYTVQTYYVNYSGTKYSIELFQDNGSSTDKGLQVQISASSGNVTLRTGIGGFYFLDTNGNTSLVSDSDEGGIQVILTRTIKNINTASDFTEYASNDDTGISGGTTADTGMVYGIGGSLFSSFASSSSYVVRKRVTFKRAIQPTDDIKGIVFYDGIPVPLSRAGTSTLSALNIAVSEGFIEQDAVYGLGWEPISDDPYSIYAYFGGRGRVPSEVDYGSNGLPWSDISNNSDYKWVFKKVSNGNMAEVPRMVRAEYKGTPAVGVESAVIYGTVTGANDEDTHSGYNKITGEYTISVSGVYQFCFDLNCAIGGNIIINLNGGEYRRSVLISSTRTQFFTTIRCIPGDIITIVTNGSGTLAASSLTKITIERIGN